MEGDGLRNVHVPLIRLLMLENINIDMSDILSCPSRNTSKAFVLPDRNRQLLAYRPSYHTCIGGGHDAI